MKFDQFRVDSKAIEDGAWRDAEGIKGIRWKVRGIGNSDYRRLQAKLIADIPREDRIKGLSPAAEDAITGQVLLDTVLVDWEGFTDDEGAPVPFSPVMAKEILTNPDFRPLMLSVEATALKLANETALDREEAAKNSVAPSTGS